MPRKEKLIPYMRKSGKEDATESRDRQTRVIRRWAAGHPDVTLAREVWEAAVTGSRDWRVRGLGLAIEACRKGEADGIIVEDISRLSRERGLATAEVWEALQAAGVRLVCVEDGIDTANGDQELNYSIRAALSREQWKQYARRMKAVKTSRIERGVHISGAVPVGYLRPERDASGAALPLVLDPERAPGIRAAFKLRARGGSLAEVVALLDERVPGGPSGSGLWNRNTVSRLLGNPVYTGEARQGELRKAKAHPAIVSATDFEACRALSREYERPAPSPGVVSLLAGVARCASCGYALDRNRSNGTYLVYRCRGRSATGKCEAPASIMAPTLDEFVRDAIRAKLAGWRVERVEAAGPDVGVTRAALAEARSKRGPFENPDYVALLGVEAATRALAKVDAEILALEDKLAEAIGADASDEPTVEELREAVAHLDDFDADGWRPVIAAMLDGVHVSRAPRGTATRDRVTPFWRGEDRAPVAPARGRRKGTEVVAGVAAA